MSRTLNVYLGERHAAFVARALKSGRVRSASELVRRGLELLMQEQQLHEAQIAAARSSPSKLEEVGSPAERGR